MNENEMLNSKKLRESYMNRTEVLDRVKRLFLIPEADVVTTKQVAEYFEVDVEAIQKVYQRNKEEIDSDGTLIKMASDFGLDKMSNPNNSKRGVTILCMQDGSPLEVNNGGTKCFSRRAVLRIAMLLRDSTVAKEVRTQLLNAFENASEEDRTYAIDEEQMLWAEVGKAIFAGDMEASLRAVCDVQKYHNRHVEALTEENRKLEEVNSLLAAGVNTWDNRAVLNAMVRAAAACRYENDFAAAWNTYYKRLQYGGNIYLGNRKGSGGKIDKIHDDEWVTALQVAGAWLLEMNLDVASVIGETNAAMLKKA
ncbi:MAG: hypothetical protein J6S14_15800 [Clostridia bacterium]|nr:hypothetical protein [Clostridia bacterium]